MAFWNSLSAWLEKKAERLAAHPRMQGRLGKLVLAIPPTPGNAPSACSSPSGVSASGSAR